MKVLVLGGYGEVRARIVDDASSIALSARDSQSRWHATVALRAGLERDPAAAGLMNVPAA